MRASSCFPKGYYGSCGNRKISFCFVVRSSYSIGARSKSSAFDLKLKQISLWRHPWTHPVPYFAKASDSLKRSFNQNAISRYVRSSPSHLVLNWSFNIQADDSIGIPHRQMSQLFACLFLPRLWRTRLSWLEAISGIRNTQKPIECENCVR